MVDIIKLEALGPAPLVEQIKTKLSEGYTLLDVYEAHGTHYAWMGPAPGISIQNGADDPVISNPLPQNGDLDNTTIKKIMQGSYQIALLNAVTGTTTSNEIDCTGFNALQVGVELGDQGSHNWTFTLLGSGVSQGNFKPIKTLKADGTFAIQTETTNTNEIIVFEKIPRYVKVVATEVQDGTTCTVNVCPVNV